MIYTMTTPCAECPFLKENRLGFTLSRLKQHASGEFGCHKACEVDEDGVFRADDRTPHCAGALIFLEKRDQSHQMMRIAERLGLYDRTKLNMKAPIR
jgi:hypothetical protein